MTKLKGMAPSASDSAYPSTPLTPPPRYATLHTQLKDVYMPPALDPTTNPDVQEALSKRLGNAAVIILPLKSGNLAVFDRSYTLREIVPADDHEWKWFADWSQQFNLELSPAAAARFYGEPDDKSLARDLKRAARQPIRLSPSAVEDLALDI